jgi:4-amino-4-deoxy-L-arabinose transferase-like glycosyltransferase
MGLVRGLTLPLILLAALTFLAGLGRGAITDADEAFYAEAAREMVQSGDVVTPTYNYEPRFQKPIFYYWLTAATFAATGGPGEAGARLWAALSGIGLVLVTAACARRWFDDGVALLSGAIVATSFGYHSIGRMALPDLPLTFFMTLAIWAGWVAMLENDRHRTRWVLLASLALGLGFLTKGPVGVIVPALVVVPVVLMERRRLNLRVSDVILAGLIFALVALPWYGVMWARHGTVYLEGFFLGDNLERFATERFNDPRPWWFYLPVVAGGLLPWTPLALVWLQPVGRFLTRRKDVETLELRLILWAALPLVFYSLSVGKQPRYILPVLPPLAMLLATSVLERTRDWRSLDGARVRVRRQMSVAAGGVVSGALLVALAALLWRASPLLINVAPTFTRLATVVIGLAGAGVIGVAASGAWRQTPVALALAAALTFPALQFGALSGAGDSTVEQVARVIAQHGTRNEAVGTHHVFVRNLVYYAQTPTVDLITDEQLSAFLRQDDRVFVVASAESIARLELAEGRRFRQLAVIPYFNEAGIRLRTLLWPDPGRDISRVVVVSNR